MQSLAFDKVIFFDLETTGFSSLSIFSKYHRIIQVSARCAQSAKSYTSFVNPEMYIPPQSTKLHGITDNDVQSAPTWSVVFETLLSEFEINNTTILVAHNAYFFDEIILKKECIRTDVFELIPDGLQFWDSLTYLRRFRPLIGKYNLDYVHRYFFGTGINDAHRADSDVEALARVFDKAIGFKAIKLYPRSEVTEKLYALQDIRYIGFQRQRKIFEATGCGTVDELRRLFAKRPRKLNTFLLKEINIYCSMQRKFILGQVFRVPLWNVWHLGWLVPPEDERLEGCDTEAEYFIMKRYWQAYVDRNLDGQAKSLQIHWASYVRGMHNV